MLGIMEQRRYINNKETNCYCGGGGTNVQFSSQPVACDLAHAAKSSPNVSVMLK
jgi:hypothetical protein